MRVPLEADQEVRAAVMDQEARAEVPEEETVRAEAVREAEMVQTAEAPEAIMVRAEVLQATTDRLEETEVPETAQGAEMVVIPTEAVLPVGPVIPVAAVLPETAAIPEAVHPTVEIMHLATQIRMAAVKTIPIR